MIGYYNMGRAKDMRKSVDVLYLLKANGLGFTQTKEDQTKRSNTVT